MFKKGILVCLFILITANIKAQNKINTTNYYTKYLPLELGFSSQSKSGFGFHLALENSIFEKKQQKIEDLSIKKSEKKVLTKILFKDFVSATKNEIRLGLGSSFRYTFNSGFQIEPEINYTFGYSFLIEKNIPKSFNDQQLDVLFGFSYNRRYKDVRLIEYYIKPGFGVDVYNSLDKKVHFVADFGFRIVFRKIKTKRWKNPLFKPKNKKPHPESEFSGSARGKEVSKVKKRKQPKLNKKKRKFRSAKKFK